jgi:WXG100 family type VII secretion target
VIAVAGRFQTTPEEMRRAAGQVRQVNEQVQAVLAQLRSQLGPLAAAWRGEAATAFAGLLRRWDADARQLGQALSGIAEAIDGSAAGYQRAEGAHRQSLTAITSALG